MFLVLPTAAAAAAAACPVEVLADFFGSRKQGKQAAKQVVLDGQLGVYPKVDGYVPYVLLVHGQGRSLCIQSNNK